MLQHTLVLSRKSQHVRGNLEWRTIACGMDDLISFLSQHILCLDTATAMRPML